MTILSVSIFIICASQNPDLFDSVYHKILKESTVAYLKRACAVRMGALTVPKTSRTHSVYRAQPPPKQSFSPGTVDKKETPLR